MARPKRESFTVRQISAFQTYDRIPYFTYICPLKQRSLYEFSRSCDAQAW